MRNKKHFTLKQMRELTFAKDQLGDICEFTDDLEQTPTWQMLDKLIIDANGLLPLRGERNYKKRFLKLQRAFVKLEEARMEIQFTAEEMAEDLETDLLGKEAA